MEDHSNPFFDATLYQSHGCILQAYGVGFEPELFLTEVNLEPMRVILKDKLKLPKQLKNKIVEASGVLGIFDIPFLLVRVSNAKSMSSQIEEATLFLTQYYNELKRLGNFPNVESISMQFLVGGNKPLIDTKNFPEFLKLVFGIGIQVSVGNVNSKS